MPSAHEDARDVARITIQAYRGALIASIQIDLDEHVLGRFQSDLLEAIAARTPKAAIIDVSGVDVMDAEDFEGLRRIIKMSSLMGTDVALCGIQAGVAAALSDLEVKLDDLTTHRNLDAALAALEALAAPAPDAADADDETETPDPQEPGDGSAREAALDSE